MSDRDRSASPRRDNDSQPKSKKQKTSGFKWKEKKSTEDNPSDQPPRGLERGYRNRSPPRRTDRRNGEEERNEENTTKNPRRRKDDFSTTTDRDPKPSKPSTSTSTSTTDNRPSTTTDQAWDAAKSAVTKKSSKKASTTSSSSSSPMIIVNINDRLGTKAAIPCLPSDSIKMFKAVVAAHIGRQPHEIMLKRQGERPFKDVLTLEDYGVSNGVQLDLEIDTGD